MSRLKEAIMLLQEFDKDPTRFIACLGCGSVLRWTEDKVCPMCKAYRYEVTAGAVREQINRLADREGRIWSDD